jgi:TldD protein
MRETCKKIIKMAGRRKAKFCDVRICQAKATLIEIRNGVARRVQSANESGVAIRVFKKGAWGFASTYSMDGKSLEETLKNAIKCAEANPLKIKTRFPEIIPYTGHKKSDCFISPDVIAQEDKVKILLQIENETRTFDPRVVNTELYYADAKVEEIVLNSEGTDTQQEIARTTTAITVTASDGTKRQQARRRIGKLCGFELVKLLDNKEFGIAAAKTACELLRSEKGPAGRFTVITDPRVSGLFAHEAVGHNAEADHVIFKFSIIGEFLGKKIASDAVTLIDDPTLPNLYGSYFYDSEGTPAQEHIIIKNGVLVGLMHSLETAGALDSNPNGSARAYMHFNKPIVRMSNTYFAPGDATLEDMISSVKFGILAKGVNWGYVFPERGQFTCNVQEAYVIRDGKLAEPIGNISIGGLTLEILKNVEVCSKEYDVSIPGTCGKGQPMWVSMGGPYMKIKQMVVGGQA